MFDGQPALIFFTLSLGVQAEFSSSRGRQTSPDSTASSLAINRNLADGVLA